MDPLFKYYFIILQLMFVAIETSMSQAETDTANCIRQLQNLHASLEEIKSDFKNIQEMWKVSVQELKNENLNLKLALNLHLRQEAHFSGKLIGAKIQENEVITSPNNIDFEKKLDTEEIISELQNRMLEKFENLTNMLTEDFELQKTKLNAINETQQKHTIHINKHTKQLNELTEMETWTKTKLLEDEVKMDHLTVQQNEQFTMANQQNTSLKRLEDNVHNLAHILQNGIFLWKIKKFSRYLEDAKAEKNITIFSSPFYTSQYGYKMRLSMYPYGNGEAEESHISIFFSIMKGAFDDVLKWPFTGNVTFMLLDQKSNDKSHHIKSFVTKSDLFYFKKPQTEVNSGFGYPKFFSLSDLKNSNYILNDIIYIKFVLIEV